MANGVTIANALGGISLASVIGLAVAAGQYKERVDQLVEERAEQKEILLEQRTLQIEQRQLNEDIEELTRKLDLLIQLQVQPPQ